MNIGPRQPSGLTPRSRYSAIVSWDAFDLSPLCRSWISFMRGWSWLIDLIWRLCLTVRGIMTNLTSSVNATIATPKSENNHEYSRTNPLIMGWMITRFQVSTRKLKSKLGPYLACLGPVRGVRIVGVCHVDPFLIRVAVGLDSKPPDGVVDCPKVYQVVRHDN